MSKLDDLIDRLVDEMATPGSNRTIYMDDIVTIIEARDECERLRAVNAALVSVCREMDDLLTQFMKPREEPTTEVMHGRIRAALAKAGAKCGG